MADASLAAVLEKRMSDALAKRSNSGRKLPRNFDGFVLKFPKINAALERLRAVFAQYETPGQEGITMDGLRSALRQLEVHVTEQDLQTVFEHTEVEIGEGHVVDSSGPARISFNVFVLCIGITHLLETAEDGKCSRLGAGTLGEAFQIVVDAFVFFDEDKDGKLTRQEIERGFASHEKLKEGSLLRSLSKRMAEMDKDSNGVCTFVEFVNAFVGWVQSQYEDATEEEESDELEASRGDGGPDEANEEVEAAAEA
eukprot:TRINITY_DN18164_c0_g1_i1.p1 TRINITY_DN18164_c0_g1~~TRINITY_DN18164_c0_g1_i1.p1  ORF type:complete len:254 (+),score=25.49 TRINITY_DN18164_c0_g1_i1:206-967(+)